MFYITVEQDFEKAKAIYGQYGVGMYLKLEFPELILAHAAYEYFVNGNHAKGEKLLIKFKKKNAANENLGDKLLQESKFEQLEALMKARQ